MLPKKFIDQVFIKELEAIINDQHPYIAFAIMAIGIEFLGKCLDIEIQDWNKSGNSKKHFELAVNKLNAFKVYREYLEDYQLWNSLRNGFAHSFVPKETLSLSSDSSNCPHLNINGNKINLKCENFYEDFKKACEKVISMDFENLEDKMNKELLLVPEDYKSIYTNSYPVSGMASF